MSAVILAVIVIMWAVVLVPMWLRRHEAATESRSADKFSTAMRVLSRRQPQTPDRRYVLMPRRDRAPSVHVSGAAASSRPGSTRPAPTAPPRPPKARPSIATRRRRVLLALGGLAFLFFVLAVAGVVGWVLQLLVDLVLVAYVAHLRTQAKRTAAAARQRRRAAAVPTAPARPAARPAYRPVYRPMTHSAAAPEVELDEPAATGTDGQGEAWDPVPVPPPTYTMKSQAPQHWTYEAPAADAPVQQPALDEPVTAESAELDEIIEHRWAVND